jgi:microcystin-dependent protein
MAEPFLGEVRIFSFNFAPNGWAMCNGQLMAINQNQALFSILGTTYGGDGRTTFGLPNLQGRVPVHVGNGIGLGEIGGESGHTLSIGEMPAHMHSATGSSAEASVKSPSGKLWGASASSPFVATANTVMNPAAVTQVGGNLAHDNQPPALVLNFCIALVGIFPSRN